MEENISNALLMAGAMLVFIIAVTLTFSLISQTKSTSDIVLYSYDDTKYYDEGYEGITYTLANENNLNRTVDMETIIPTVYRYIKENYGVTIIKEDGTILARFDSTTESIVNRWQGYYNLKKTNSNSYTLVSNFYNNLMSNLKSIDVYEQDSNGNSSKKTINLKWEEESNYSGEFAYKNLTRLWNRIYKQTGGANNLGCGAAFEGTPKDIARRLDLDFGGNEQEYIEYGYIKYYGLGGKEGLLKQYGDKKFKEVFLFVSDDDKETDDTTGDSVVVKAGNTTKLEIIYVMED